MSDQQNTGDGWTGNFDPADFLNDGGVFSNIDFDAELDLADFDLDIFAQTGVEDTSVNEALLTTGNNMDTAVDNNSVANTNPGLHTNDHMSTTSHATSPGLKNTEDGISGVENEPNANTAPRQLSINANLSHVTGSEETSGLPQPRQKQSSFQAGSQGIMFDEGQSYLPIHSAPQDTQQPMFDFPIDMSQQFEPIGQTANHFGNDRNPQIPMNMAWGLDQGAENMAWLQTTSTAAPQQDGGHMAFTNGQGWENQPNLNSSLVRNVHQDQSQNLPSGSSGNPPVQPLGLPESISRMITSERGKRLREQFDHIVAQTMSDIGHSGQQVPQTKKAQAPPPTRSHAQNHQRVATRAAPSHDRFFPNMKAKAFDPSVPLRLDTSTEPKMDLTGAKVLQPGDLSQLDPRALGGLFSKTIGSQNAAAGKSLASGRPQRRCSGSDEVKTRPPKSSTLKQLNEVYQRKITEAQSQSERGNKGQIAPGSRSAGVSDGRVTKRQAQKPARKPSSGPGSGSPKAIHHATGSGVGATPVSRRDEKGMDAAAMKAMNYAFYLGSLSAAKDTAQGKGSAPKETMPLEDLAKLVTQVPEFFKSREEPSQEAPDPGSGFTPQPPHGLTATTADEDISKESNNWSVVPMVDGSGSTSGSAQRIPSADAIQGQMEEAMNGNSKARAFPTPTRPQVAPITSVIQSKQAAQNGASGAVPGNMGLPHQPRQTGAAPGTAAPGTAEPGTAEPGTAEPGTALPANNPQEGEALSSSDECNGLLGGSSSPFQINGGRAHIDQESLRQQTKATSNKATEPKGGRKRAASEVLGAGEQEIQNKPKRKRNYKKKNAVVAAPTAVEQEQGAAVTDCIDTTLSNGDLPGNLRVGTGLPIDTTTENNMGSSSPTIAHSIATKKPMPLDELEAWAWSAPPTGKPLTKKQKAELDALFERTAARIKSAPGQANNPIDFTAIGAL